MKLRIALMMALATAVPGIVLSLGWGSMGCSSGDTSEYTVPSEISPVPTTTGAQASLSLLSSFKAAIGALAKAATDPSTDYSNAVTRTYIEERTLEQFGMLEAALNALEQTHYWEETGEGAYSAKVAWEEKEGKGSVEADVKRVETWYVEATLIEGDGVRVRVWMEQDGEGGPELVRAQLVITAPPSRKSDGSYAHYGKWEMHVKFGEGINDYFVATSSLSGDDNILMLHDRFMDHFPGGDFLTALQDRTVDMKALMHRSAASGYGKVSHPDFAALFDPDQLGTLTSLPMSIATYAYNATHLAVKDGNNAAVYKDRTATVPMTHRYGVFNADTGEDILKSKSFGFPVRFEAGGIARHGYYGAWQGRHQLWVEHQSGALPEGTAVTRDDIPPGEAAEAYLVGPTFRGTLAKRSYITADLSDIENIPVEIWVDQHYHLVYANCDGDAENEWCECLEVNWQNPGQCAAGRLATSAFDLSSLLVGESDPRKHVSIDGFDQISMKNKHFVSVTNGGLYEAQETETPFGMKFISTGVPINPNNVPMLFVNIGGSIFVEYRGASIGWVEKELASFDNMSWKPAFKEGGDKPYDFPQDRELYVNMEGANYVVTRDGSSYTVRLELQTVANPVNAATFVPDGTVFRRSIAGSGSTYEFITDSTSPNFLMLVYKTIGDDDKDPQGNANSGVAVGAVVAQSIWGLRATIGGVDTDFNWEYSDNGGWGSVTYLKNAGGSFKLLDDPVLFNSITVTNGAGVSKTLSLKFDGWLHGLPEMYQELEKNGWVITADIKNKIINIPAGTRVVDAVAGTAYLLKPLEQGLFLEAVADPGNLSLAAAEALDLSIVPDFVEHGMGDIPADAPLYYSEGRCVHTHCGAAP